MILTDEWKVNGYQATIETAARNFETQLFARIPETETAKPSGFDADGNNQKVSVVSGTSAETRVGPNIVLNRTPLNSDLPVNDQTGSNFLYFNQCAIRVSLTLRKSGIDISGAQNISNSQAGSIGAYGNGNILGAKNLAGFLFKFGTPEIYNGIKTDVVSKLNNRTGIVYFENFIEDGRRSNSATHIDLWDKNHYMSPYPFTQMFNATRIFFWNIK